MCMGKVYLDDGSEMKLLMEDLSTIEVDGNTIRMATLFGDQQEINAVIKHVDFDTGQITVVEA